MKEEYVNPFLAPADLVWQKELGHCLQLLSANAVSHRYTTEDITAVIGVSGRLQGNILYGFSDETAKAVIKIMIGDETPTSSELALSALGEIANMISGNAATELANAGYPCVISPPVMIEPVGSTITTLGGPQILVTFGSEVGTLRIRISLTESAEHA